MLDIQFIRQNADAVKRAAKVKRIECDVDALLEIDAELLKINRELQDVQTAKNASGKKIAKAEADQKKQLIEEMAEMKKRDKELSAERDRLEPLLETLMLQAPQVPADDVPEGKDDTENVELRTFGEIPKFDFDPKDHVELGETLGMIDIPRGVKLGGTRSYMLTGAGAMMHWAVLRLAMDYMVDKGYEPVYPPMLVRKAAMQGTGYLPGGEDQAYHCEKDDVYLVGTAEVSVTAFHMDEILEAKDLPRKFVALSSCFRREAGTYGKDTAGIYRIHQFDKVEQVIIGLNDEQQSIALHDEILANSEAVLQALKLPYRIVNVCSGDLGRGQVKKFDIETYMPSRGAYGETHSASRFYEFQARRLNMRYRDEEGKLQFCHTLNNTVIASPRILIPLLEIYQNADGSVTVPQALRPYMNGVKTIEPKK